MFSRQLGKQNLTTKILETANKEAASIVSTARSDASEIVAKVGPTLRQKRKL